MPDTFGALTLPAPVPATGTAVTDPALDYILAYLKAVLIHDLGAAWAAVSPSEPIVNVTMAEDPERCEFVDSWCPAMFCWRGDRLMTERMADDLEVEVTSLRLLWIFEPTSRDRQALREPIINGFAKSIRAAIARGRHRAWVVAGDPDPWAATRGSSLLRYCGLQSARCDFVERTDLSVQMENNGGRLRPYEGFFASIAIRENLTRDPAAYALDENAAPATAKLELDTSLDGSPSDVLLVEWDEP